MGTAGAAFAGGTTESGPDRTITVLGQGSVSVEPDIASSTLGVQATAATIKEAVEENSTTMNRVLEAVKAAGVAEDDIHTQHFSVYEDRSASPERMLSRVQQSGRSAERGTVYRVDNTVTVVIRDIERVGAVLDAALGAGANTVHGVTFTVESREEPAKRARVIALRDAREKADELARAAGLSVGPVVRIQASGDGYSPLRFAMAEGLGGAGPFNPGQLDVNAAVEVTFELDGGS